MWPFKKKEEEDESHWTAFMRVEICKECGKHPRLTSSNRGDVKFSYGVCAHCGSEEIRKCIGQYKIEEIWIMSLCFIHEKDFNPKK